MLDFTSIKNQRLNLYSKYATLVEVYISLAKGESMSSHPQSPNDLIAIFHDDVPDSLLPDS